MAAFGFRPSDYQDGGVEVWPENVHAFNIFYAMRHQWRVSEGVAFGLDHNVLFTRIDRLRLSDEDAAELEEDVMTMEAEALTVMNDERERRAKNAARSH